MSPSLALPAPARIARFSSGILVALSLSRLGCGQNSGDAAPPSTGGSSSGGQAATGGSSGGTPSSGGSTGGASSTGGVIGTGGTSTGGSSTGGVTGGTNTGGTSSGGITSDGGAPPSTGGKSMGGAPSTGGAAGGATTTGGAAGKASTGGTPTAGGSTGNDVCTRLDVANPPKALSLTGSLGAHDPALIAADNQFYLFATGIAAKTSKDLLSWQNATAFAKPAWVAQQVSGATNLWAPDISFFGGQYHLYYAASTFGSNKSCIGHATRASLSSGSWTDHGSVICSNASGSSDNWNAIDPNVIVDDAGTPWLNFGSFWGGIKMIKLDETGARADTQLLSLAARPQNGGALEGPFIIKQCGYYFLFVSFDHCCDSPWNYNIRVGRSTSVTGPYTDKTGTAMMQGGGTLLVQGNTTWQGPGHNAIIVTSTGAYNVYHALNPSSHAASLRVAQIAWDDQGWPVSGGP
ncbi:MAG TPA: arabinan endo-1,5-alpha-L-arabinosidase [Polyangiaceae bacterium]|nr:arabinan endo-1,5-alpha-L-arabinosidase [Polyangiaceae bacterium]